MAQFITFITEAAKKAEEAKKPHHNRSILIIQKIVDMADDGHIDVLDDRYVINVGKLIKQKNLYDFTIVIRKGKEKSIKLGQNINDDKMAIVIDTKRLPARHKIDTFLSNVEIYDELVEKLEKYLSDHHLGSDLDAEASTSYEKSRNLNQRSVFENKYKEMRQAIETHLADYKSSKKEIERELETTGSPVRKESLKLALNHLKREEIGNTSKEFVSKMLKLADPEFLEHLQKEWKNKLISRLKDYYDHLDV